MNCKSPQRLSILRSAVRGLNEAVSLSGDDLAKDAALRRFRTSFGLVQNILREYLRVYSNIQVSFPKRILKEGCYLGVLDNEGLWLQMMKDNQNAICASNTDVGKDIVDRIRNKYAQAMTDLVNTLKKEIDE